MKLGTSVRFLFPTSPATHERFRSLLASMPKGAFIANLSLRPWSRSSMTLADSFSTPKTGTARRYA